VLRQCLKKAPQNGALRGCPKRKSALRKESTIRDSEEGASRGYLKRVAQESRALESRAGGPPGLQTESYDPFAGFEVQNFDVSSTQ
jgi:hypothetical protein